MKRPARAPVHNQEPLFPGKEFLMKELLLPGLPDRAQAFTGDLRWSRRPNFFFYERLLSPLRDSA